MTVFICTILYNNPATDSNLKHDVAVKQLIEYVEIHVICKIWIRILCAVYLETFISWLSELWYLKVKQIRET